MQLIYIHVWEVNRCLCQKMWLLPLRKNVSTSIKCTTTANDNSIRSLSLMFSFVMQKWAVCIRINQNFTGFFLSNKHGFGMALIFNQRFRNGPHVWTFFGSGMVPKFWPFGSGMALKFWPFGSGMALNCRISIGKVKVNTDFIFSFCKSVISFYNLISMTWKKKWWLSVMLHDIQLRGFKQPSKHHIKCRFPSTLRYTTLSLTGSCASHWYSVMNSASRLEKVLIISAYLVLRSLY